MRLIFLFSSPSKKDRNKLEPFLKSASDFLVISQLLNFGTLKAAKKQLNTFRFFQKSVPPFKFAKF
jgi:hypothetical protein